MSVQAITWALDYPAGSVTEKVILLVLANYANEYGISWPSQKTLADQSACTDRTVRTILSRLEGQGVVQRLTRRRDNGSRRSDIVLLSGFEGRKPAPPGMFDGDPDDPCEQAERRSASSPNRKGFPGDNRKGFPHPPETASALDTSKILKSASLRPQPDSRRACLAVAGPGLDREAEASSISAFEIARWIEAGCDLALDILPVIAAKSRDTRSAPIRGWSFFTPAILEAKARREKPSATNPLPAIAAMPGTPLLKKLIGQGPRRPTPTPEEVALVLPVAKLLAAALAPAKPARAAQLIARLVGHYPQQALAEDIRTGLAEDWLEDLAHLPEDIIDAACAGWRRAENKFAPTPGHLLAIANPILVVRRFLAQQGALIAGLPETKAARPEARKEAT